MDKVVEFIKKNKVKVAGALIMIAAFVILLISICMWIIHPMTLDIDLYTIPPGILCQRQKRFQVFGM